MRTSAAWVVAAAVVGVCALILLAQTTTNYVDSTGAVTWNVAANAPHNNNIAGIGRDDGSALIQRQSQSINTAATGNLVTMGIGTIAADNASNPNTLPADRSFLIWGDDGGAATFSTPITAPAGISANSRLTRVWRVQETGVVGTVTVAIPLAAANRTAHLVVSSDAAFDAADMWIPVSSLTAGATTYWAADADFTSGQFFTFAQTPAAAGGVGANQVLWLPADAGIAAGDGQQVPQWTNQVLGSTYHVTQATAAARPLYFTTTTGELVNFNPSVRFDGADDELRNAARLYASTAGWQVFAVAVDRRTNRAELRGTVGIGSNGNEPGLDLQTDGVSPNGWNPFFDGSSPAEWSGGAALLFNGNGGGPNRQPQIFAMGSANLAGGSNNVVSWVDGFQETTTLDSFRQADLGAAIFVGSSDDAQWLGLVTEVVAFDRLLTAGEVQQVNSYLALKYGITLDQRTPTSYLDSGGAVIWDATANSTHRFNIAGVGRDDGQLLDQMQSASVNLGNVLTIGVGTIAATNVANPSNLAADRSFLVLGDDNQSTTISLPITPPGGLASATRMSRSWKVQETGTIGAVVAAVPSNTAAGSALFLVVSNDATFDATDQWIPTAPLTAGATSYRAASFDFTSGQFFTFASALAADLGDAPASYATLVANDGARHAVPNHDASAGTAPLMLGTRIDTENDGQPTALADGDDTAGVDDEDGVAFPPLVAGQSANLTVTVANNGPPPRLNAWADFNNNGSFADAGEQFVTSLAVSAGANTVPIAVPASARGATAFRFRLSTQTTLDPTGLAPDGEVEDYIVTIVAQPDLAIGKTDGQTSYVPGASIAYTLTVTNGGPAASVGFTVNDAVPASITGVAATCVVTGAGSCGANASAGNTVSFTGLSLAPGAANHLAITVTGTVTSSTSGDLVNTATVSAGAGEIDPVTTNNSATDTDTQGAGVADLAIAKSDGQTGYVAGAPIGYTVTVTNAGPSNAGALNVSDTVPAAIAGVAATCVSAGTASCGTNASTGNTVSFTGASLNAGAGNSLTITISGTISPSATGTLVNTATVSVPGGASYSDPNLGNNSATDANTAGTPQVDLAIAKTDDQASYVPGAPITYTLRVRNAGPSLATGFSVGDVVPPAISGVTAACTVVGFGSCGTNATAGGTVSFTNLSLAPGAGNELAISVTGTVSPDTTGPLANTATVTAGAGTSETVLGNNSATDTDTQGPGVADLAISKTDGQAGYVAGTPIAYTIAVTNAGPSHAPTLDISDVVPAMIAGVTVGCIPTGAASCGTNGSTGNNIAFTGASLNAGAANTLTLTIAGTIDPSFVGGNIVNTAQVAVPAAAGYSDPSLGNNTATDIDTPLPQQVDLAIAKTDGQTSYVPGAAIAYTLTVANAGPSTATDVEVTDFVPAGVTGVTASCVASGLATCGTNATVANAVDFTNVSVAPGAGNQLTFTITGTVSPDATGPLANTATVIKGSNATEANLANNSATDSDTQAAGVADLMISKTDGATTYTPGTAISYLIEVSNAGPSHAVGFNIDDVVPADVTGVSVSCSVTNGVGNCGVNVSAGNTIAFSGVSLNAGAALTLLVSGTTNPSATANLVNTATVTVHAGASFSDPDPLSNTATDVDTPTAQTVDLAIAKSDGQPTYVAGTPITYTLTVTNAGPSTATGVIIRDAVPAAIAGVSLSCAATGTSTCGSDESAGSDLISNNATVVPGDTLTLTISGTVRPATTGDLVNTATVTAGPTDIEGNTVNNTATDTDTAGTPQIDLGIAKTDNAPSYVPGTVLSYVVTVTNAGPSTATGFSVTDVVPAALTGVTATCAVTGTADCGIDGSAGNTASFTAASLAPGAANALTVTITGTVSASATGNLVNTATLTAGAGSTDTNPANDSATDTDTQGTSVVDLAITKDDGRASYVAGTPITYTLVVVNAGPSLATGVSVNDAVPVAITGITTTCVAGGTATCGTNASSGNTVSFTGASLPPGAANGLTITVNGVVSPSATGTLINTATVAAGAGATDPTAANNSATDIDTAGTPQVDLAVTKTDGQGSYVPGTPISYTVLVTNAGPSDATGVSVSDVVPASITGVTATCVAAGTTTCGTNGSSGSNVTFTGASVPPGAGNTLTLTIGGTVNASATGSIANTVTVTAGAASVDTNAANNSATDISTQGAALADLALTKAAVEASVVPGGTFTYRLVVTNNGPSVAANVAITDALPAPLTFVSSPQGCTAAGQTVSCGTIASLAPAASFTFDIVVRLNPSYTGNGSDIGNVATATSSTADPVPGNETTPPAPPPAVGPPSADVSTTKAAVEAAVTPGQTFTYRITVSNAGPSTATNVIVTDALPAPLAFVSSPSGCTAAAQNVTCPTVPLLAVNSSVDFDLVVRLDPAYTGDGSDIGNVATATSTTTDPNAGNDASPPAPPPPVGPPSADVQIVKNVSAALVLPGQNYFYTLQVTNNGPSVATGVVVTDALPTQSTFVSSVAGCTAAGASVTCPTVATMTVGEIVTFDLVVQLSPAYTGDGTDILNSSTVTAATADPALANNTSPAGAPPVGPPGADVAIVKDVSADPVSPGETFTYTLLASNQGPSNATNVVVTDPLPAGVTFVSSPQGCSAVGQAVICPTVATMAPGGSATFTLVVQLDPGYTGNGSDLPNAATVASDTVDPTPGNNTSAPATPTIGPPSADLTTTKAALEASVVPGGTFTYRIVVTNNGPSTATGVGATDTLPAPLTFVSSPSACTAAGAVVTCPPAATVAVGANATFDIVVQLSPTYTGDGSDISNVATPTSGTADPNPGNDASPPAPPPPVGAPSADLSIGKSILEATVTPGGSFTYRITVTNAGPSVATTVQVTDTLPAGVTFVSSPSGCLASAQTVSCGPVAVLAVGAAASFDIAVRLDPAYTGNGSDLPNVATTTSFTPDANTANNSSPPVTPVVGAPSADLSTTKAAVEASVTPGQTFTYRITVSNAGPSAATGVVVTDALPAPLAFVSSPSGCTASGQNVTCPTVATLAAGSSAVFDLVVRLDAAYTGNGSDIGNVASTTSGTPDPNPANNTTPPSPPPPIGASQADVQIVKHVSAAQVLPGETYSYTLRVTNNGPSVATGVVAKDVLPPQATFVSSTAGCTAAGASVTCPTVATLAVGGSVTFDLVVQLSPAYTGDGSDILNSSTVTAATADPALANNTSPAGAPPVGPPGADVTIVKDVSADPVAPGEAFTYTLLATNQGPSNATSVVVSDPLPAGLVFVSSPEGCTASGQTVTCQTIATLLPGASASFTLVVQLDPSYGGNGSDLQNRATIASATADPASANNTSNPATPIVGAASADVAIAKSVVEPAVSPGETLTYRLVITNAGPSTALGIAVSDTLPAQTAFVGSPSACTASGATVTCPSVPTLAVGASATYDITVRLDAGYTGNGSDVLNVAAITPSTPDPNAANNTTPPVPLPPVSPASADLSVTKSVLEPSLVPGQSVTYRITVANAGPANALNVVTVDTLPSAMTFVSSPSSCTASGQVVTCPTMTSLGVGATAVFDIVARLDPSYQGNGSDVVNRAVVSATTADLDPSDNTTPPTVLPPVGPASADVSLVKTASAISVTPGGTFPYRIDVTNAGPSTAVGVVVSDPLPAALAFVSSASGCTASGQTVTCPPVGALVPGAMATFEFVVQLDAAYVGDGSDLANTASVSSTTADPNGANNSSTAPAPPFVPAVADVAVNLSVSNTTPTIGDTVVFTVTAANLGPSLVTGLVVSANLPSGLAFVSADQPAYNPATGLWTIGTLPAGGSVTLQITASVTEAGLITTTALKTGGQQIDPNTANDSAAVGLNAVPNADVALSKSVDVSAPNVGDTVTFVVTAGNRGPSPAAGLVVTDDVPPGLTLVAATPSQGTFNAATHQWTLGTLDVGAVATLALAVRVDAAGPASNTAFVSARGQLDLNEINDSATVAINGQAVANIGLTKTASRPEALVGEQVSFQIAVTNHGPSPRPSLAVLDQLPAGLTFVSATASQGAYDAGTGRWTVGSLVPTQSAVLEIVATLAVDGTFVNAASVIADPSAPPDLNEGDNAGTAVVTVQPVADVVVSVSGPGTAHQGERVTWTVRVRNDGPSSTAGVRAVVALPPGLELVSATPSAGTFDAATGEWVIGALPLGAAAELTLETDVTGAGQLVLEASRTASDVFDPVTANNQSAAALQAINTADLQVQLTVDRTAPALGESVQLLLRVTNAGPVRVTGLVASLPLPPGVTLVSSSPSSGVYNAGDGSWTIGTLPVGGEVLLIVTAQVTTTAPVTILAQTIAFAQSDPQPANNQSGVVLQAQAADLQLVKTVDRPQLLAGDRARYRLVVTNNGPSVATGVVVTEQLPAALTYVSHTASHGVFDPATGAWTVGTLAAAGAGSYATLEIEVLVMGGAVSNAAAVTALDQTDATASNNADQQSVTSEAWSTFFADLVLQGTVSPPVATSGQPLTFQLAGINRGPTYVLDAFITGDVPAGTTFESVAVSPGGTCETPPAGGTGVVTCTWAGATRLDQGAQRSMALTVRTNADAAPGGVITGRFRISSATPEYYEPSNSVVVSTSVAGATAADLAVAGVMLSEGVLGTELPVPVGVGTPLRFTVTNVGPTTSIGSRFAIEIPEPEMPFVQILAIEASAGIIAPTGPSSGEWTLGALAPGESASFDLTLAYHRMWATSILMRRVESAPADPNNTNDRALLVLDGVGDPGGSERYAAIGNVTGGSFRDVVTGAGRLETPQVRIYRGDGQDTGLRFYAYDRRFVGGVRVATCDVDADGIDEIVTAPGYGPGPHVRVLTLRGGAVEEIVGFYAFDPNFPGGVYPACTDLDGDGRAEVIAAMGIGGSPEVRIFAVGPGRADQIGSFMAYEPTFTGGVRVAAVNPGTAGASAYRILTVPGPGRPVEIRAFQSTGTSTVLVRTLPVTGPEYQLGAFLTVGDVNADGLLDVVLASDMGIPALVAGVTLDSGAFLGSFQPFGPSFMGGARVSLGDIDADGRMELLVSPGVGGRPVVDTYTILNGLLLRYRLNPIELPF